MFNFTFHFHYKILFEYVIFDKYIFTVAYLDVNMLIQLLAMLMISFEKYEIIINLQKIKYVSI